MNELEGLTIKEIVTQDYRAAEVFERYSLDFCCGGAKTILEVCGEKSLDPVMIISDLMQLSQSRNCDANRYNTLPLDALIDHIVAVHHGYVGRMLPTIFAHTQKVASVHGGRHPEVIEIAARFATVATELQSHMMKEENILFPYIKALVAAEANGDAAPSPPFGSARNPIRMMEQEHQSAGNELYEIRSLSASYTPPEDACTTYRVTYQELQEFESDLHRHVHLENNILFPKAIALEDRIPGKGRR